MKKFTILLYFSKKRERERGRGGEGGEVKERGGRGEETTPTLPLHLT